MKVNPEEGYVKRTKYTPNEIRIKENLVELDVYNPFGKYKTTAIFSIEDLELLKQYKWYQDNTGYISTTTNGIKKRFHTFIFPGKITDHIDNNKLNNTRTNLRPCEHWQNTAKKRQYNSKEIIGVTKTYSNTYQAHIEHFKKVTRKNYKTEEDAIIQRFIWELNMFREFAPNIDKIKEKYPFLLNVLKYNAEILDRDTSIMIIKRIADKKYCPCRLQQTDENLCMCQEFQNQNSGVCHCQVFKKLENTERR